MSWLCSLSENSPYCHYAGSWWASGERVEDRKERKVFGKENVKEESVWKVTVRVFPP